MKPTTATWIHSYLYVAISFSGIRPLNKWSVSLREGDSYIQITIYAISLVTIPTHTKMQLYSMLVVAKITKDTFHLMARDFRDLEKTRDGRPDRPSYWDAWSHLESTSKHPCFNLISTCLHPYIVLLSSFLDRCIFCTTTVFPAFTWIGASRCFQCSVELAPSPRPSLFLVFHLNQSCHRPWLNQYSAVAHPLGNGRNMIWGRFPWHRH